MTTERRVAAIEAALTPTERVVRWLEEAHAYGDHTAYAKAVYAAGPDALPLDRLADEAADAVRPAHPRRTPEDRTVVQEAVQAILFLVHLANRINEVADTVWRREPFVYVALTAHVALREATDRPGGPTLLEERELLFERVAELHAQQAARTRVEATYLAGHPALFPATAEEWAAQVKRSEEAAVMVLRLCELDALSPLDEDRFVLTDEGRVSACIDDLVEAVRIKTLEQMGDGRAAIERAIRWLGPRLSSGSVDTT